MTRLTSSIVLLMVGVVFEGAATAQVVTFTREDYASNAGGRAIVSGDFNRDGWLDVAHANGDGDTVTILLGHAVPGLARAFTVAVGRGPFDLTSGDLNRDGIADLAVANADGNSISILLGAGDGSFARSDVAAPLEGPRGVADGDMNNDGRPDLVYAGFVAGTVQVLLGDGLGHFARGATYSAPGSEPQGVAIGDFNRDGRADVAVASRTGLRILQGISGGGLTARSIPGHSFLNVVALGDVNSDGWTDIAAASTAQGDVSVYLGGPAGPSYAAAYSVGPSPRGVALADVNDDGRLDVITANRGSNTISLLSGNPAHPGTFLGNEQFASGNGSRALVSGDFDGDGRIDVVTSNQYAATVTVLSNATAFTRAAFSFAALTVPSAVPLGISDTADGRFETTPPRLAVADMNRDGRPDFIATGGPAGNPDGVVVMLRDGPTVTLAGPRPLSGFLIGDFNGDSNPDVLYYSADPVATDQVTRLLTYFGDGAGHFTASRTTVEPLVMQSCASGDVNRDGRLDLVCDGAVLIGNGNGTFVAGEGGGSNGAPGPFLADVNRDGKLDLIDTQGVHEGDGDRHFGTGESFEGRDFQSRLIAVGDLNRDGYVDLVFDPGPTEVWLVYGSAAGFTRFELQSTLEGFSGIAIADLDLDGNPDLVLNGSTDTEGAGILQVLFGSRDGTFTAANFALTLGAIVVADINSDGLPDVAAFDPHAVQVLLNERNETNHDPVLPDYSRTSGNPCVTLDARESDPDQHALSVEWFNACGAFLHSGVGNVTALDVCVEHPGTYTFRRTATDGRGGTASGTVTFTYVVTMQEIVLYAGASNVAMTGNWSRVADPTAAGGVRAHDANAGSPKVPHPAATPTDAITIPFVADPNLTYKLWVRMKADQNVWSNDSVWVQFSGAATEPYTAGTTIGLAVSLEECVGCGVSEWGWQDDGYGAINAPGVLLRFDPGPQTIVIQTREDGVSIDQVVLSAAHYLAAAPGAAKRDHTILPATAAP